MVRPLLCRHRQGDDAKVAQEAEAGLKNAIDQAIKRTTKPARLESLNELEGAFELLRYLCQDPASQARQRASGAESASAHRQSPEIQARRHWQQRLRSQAIEFGTKQVNAQFRTASAAATNFVLNSERAASALAVCRPLQKPSSSERSPQQGDGRGMPRRADPLCQ
jgi:hypothetical protein